MPGHKQNAMQLYIIWQNYMEHAARVHQLWAECTTFRVVSPSGLANKACTPETMVWLR